jgi:pyridoxamine 5'-phosphate oxidase
MDTLTEEQAPRNPFELFRHWFAAAADLPEPNAMTLATATPDGRPSARMVLLKAYDDRGFVFYTNYQSRKGNELATNPWAALILFWPELHRQIRIEGRVEKTSSEESDTYFATRARGSQIAAAASAQSQRLASRQQLEDRVRELEERWAGREVPRPAFWGGYRVAPSCIEFWQGRPNRLHDRLRYTRLADGSWMVERLAP